MLSHHSENSYPKPILRARATAKPRSPHRTEGHPFFKTISLETDEYFSISIRIEEGKNGLEISVLGLAETQIEALQAVSASSDPYLSKDPVALVAQLTEAADAETIDTAMAEIQKSLRAGDSALADQLVLVANVKGGYGSDEQGLAIQALAGARVPAFEPLVVSAISHLCELGDERAKVASIAAATHLSPEGKTQLRESVERLVSTSTPRVRKAAEAFLRYAPNPR